MTIPLDFESLLRPGVTVAAAIVLGYLMHRLFWRLLRRVADRTSTVLDDALLRHCRRPTALMFPVLALYGSLPLVRGWLGDELPNLLGNLLIVPLIVSVAWTLVRLTSVAEDVIGHQFDVDVADNLRARAIRTQFGLIRKIVVVVIGTLAVATMFMSFEEFRDLGAGLLASAGLVGLVVGLAAQKALGNLLAGIQIAITQPIRLDDVVIVEGEWGRVEDITLTYVVVRIWDLRRLVLPISYFLETPFQNWTRTSAAILGTVYLHMDYTVPVDEIRVELDRIVRASENWDGEVCGVQVTDTSPQGIEVRALMSSADASKSWDLRCEVREKLVAFLRENYPQSLPRLRAELQQR